MIIIYSLVLCSYIQLCKNIDFIDASMLKKDQTDIVKPPKVKDDELLYVHTQEYLDGIQVRILIH